VTYSIKDIGAGTVLGDTTYPYTIGARGALGAGTFFDGIIDEVRLYNRALSAREVAELYYYVSSCPSHDLNADCIIDFDDVLIFSTRWLWVGPPSSIAEDIVEDGVENFADFARLAEDWLDTWNLPPEVHITKPGDGAQFHSSQTVEIEADAWDADGLVVKVEFLADGNNVEEDSDGTDGWKTDQTFSVGSYNLTAKASDDRGASAISPVVWIDVKAPPR
jgi:hypothetical protein